MSAVVTEVVVRHHPRRFGTSKYGIGRTIRVMYDLITLQMLTRFSARPLHWFGLGSLPCLLLAVPEAWASLPVPRLWRPSWTDSRWTTTAPHIIA